MYILYLYCIYIYEDIYIEMYVCVYLPRFSLPGPSTVGKYIANLQRVGWWLMLVVTSDPNVCMQQVESYQYLPTTGPRTCVTTWWHRDTNDVSAWIAACNLKWFTVRTYKGPRVAKARPAKTAKSGKKGPKMKHIDARLNDFFKSKQTFLDFLWLQVGFCYTS